MTQATPKALSKDDIIKATAQDATLQEVMHLGGGLARACGAPCLRKFGKLSIRETLVMT